MQVDLVLRRIGDQIFVCPCSVSKDRHSRVSTHHEALDGGELVVAHALQTLQRRHREVALPRQARRAGVQRRRGLCAQQPPAGSCMQARMRFKSLALDAERAFTSRFLLHVMLTALRRLQQ